MKKSLLLVSLLSVGMLAACGPTSSSSNSTVEPKTFQEQLKAAGITLAYEDPNAPISQTIEKPADEDIDCVAGVSGDGTDYYPGEGSYYTYDQMVERANLKYYYSVTWEETEKDGAKTLKEASELANAKYVTDLFPNDGKAYTIKMSGNSLATKTVVTKDEEGNLYAAIYGMGARKHENGNYYVTGTITTKATLTNLVKSGTAMVVMYEYNPTTGDKMGAGARNYGCRLKVSLDAELSKLSVNGETVAPVVGEDLPAGTAYGSVFLKVDAMYTIG